LLVRALVVAVLVATIPASAPTAVCFGARPTIVGTAGNDRLVGTPGPDVISAGDGDDEIIGDDGDDLICAGPGNDVVSAGPGNDSVTGDQGDDTLAGGPGDDHLLGAAGDDTLDGGDGGDSLSGGPGADRLLEVLAVDRVTDSGTAQAAGDTWWYPSLTLEPRHGSSVVFPNSVSGYDQRHTHAIEVTNAADGLLLVETLPPEEYLLGIAEMPYSWAEAALEAQVVAARTYLAYTLANPPRGAMAEFGFDICGTALCQSYLGPGRLEVVSDGDRWAAAVEATAGQGLLYQGAPALAAYHSTAGATTRSVQDVWMGAAPLPYLQAVDVPSQDSPFAEWSYDLDIDQFLEILRSADMTFDGDVTSIDTTVTQPGGGPYRVVFQTTLGPVEVSADRIQTAMNTYGPTLYPGLLPAYRPDGARFPQAVLSPTFTVRTLVGGTTVRIDGQGWGHQLGLPQYGAQAMALEGSDAASILSHFYSGLQPVPDPGFLPDEITVGLAWDRSSVTLQADDYRLTCPDGVVAEGVAGDFLLSVGEGGMVVLSAP
jgi:SpoIID/LytB domain protein